MERPARLGQMEGCARLRESEDRAHRDPGPWQRVLVSQREDPDARLTGAKRLQPRGCFASQIYTGRSNPLRDSPSASHAKAEPRPTIRAGIRVARQPVNQE